MTDELDDRPPPMNHDNWLTRRLEAEICAMTLGGQIRIFLGHVARRFVFGGRAADDWLIRRLL
jgi:hypothetical protein